MIRQLSVLIGIALLAVAGHAGAATTNEEEALIRHGIELRKAQDDMAARAEFQKAYELTYSPRAAAQLGLAEFALGRWDEAEAHVGEALRTPEDPWIKKYRKELDQSLGTIKTHVARVEVTGDPVGAEVYVNGRRAGRLPLNTPVAVSEGQVDVELRARGFARANRTVTVAGGQYQRLVIRLDRDANNNGKVANNAKALAAAIPIIPGAVDTTSGALPVGDAHPQPEPSGSPTHESADTAPSVARRVAKWTSLGLAGAALATGITATVIYNRNLSTFQSNVDCYDQNGRAVDRNERPVPACQPSLDVYRSARTWSIAGYVGAGVFAATWLALALTEPTVNGTLASHPVAAWTCAPTLSAAGAVCAARF